MEETVGSEFKICRSCKESRPVSEYRSDRTRKGGKSYICKFCANRKAAVWVKKTGFYLTQEYRDKTAHRRTYQARKAYERKYAAANKEKLNARQAVYRAIKSGSLVRGKCVVCGAEKVQAHHHLGYEKHNWINVQWLCQTHHSQAHNQ
jgi:hypothetical protein